MSTLDDFIAKVESAPDLPEYRRHPRMPNVLLSLWADRGGRSHINFECRLCQFSTLEEQKMRDHQFHEDHHWPWPDGVHPFDRQQQKEEE